jgi:phosphoribosylglycinamide formyltransferase
MQAAREEHDTDLAQMVLQDRPARVICLGFLHVLTKNFWDPIEKAQVKIINPRPLCLGLFLVR